MNESCLQNSLASPAVLHFGQSGNLTFRRRMQVNIVAVFHATRYIEQPRQRQIVLRNYIFRVILSNYIANLQYFTTRFKDQ